MATMNIAMVDGERYSWEDRLLDSICGCGVRRSTLVTNDMMDGTEDSGTYGRASNHDVLTTSSSHTEERWSAHKHNYTIKLE